MYYSKNVESVLKELKTSLSSGIDESETEKRKKEYGINKITEKKKTSLIVRFLRQFKNIMVLILLVSAFLSIFLAIKEGEYSNLFEGFIILFIVIINATIGVIQENKAEACLKDLQNKTTYYTFVLRSGKKKKINIEDLVVGDIVFLEAGDIVPADIRLTDANNLKVDESALTGESVAVSKNYNEIYSKTMPIAEQKNICFKGTVVTSGKAVGVVFNVGDKTEFGKIASFLFETKKSLTPLEKSIDKIGKFLTYGILIISAIIFVSQLIFTDNSLIDGIMLSVALAVAAIPESLSAVITLILALGVQQMAKHKVIVKQLHAVETLGSCEVICTDKTGTLTENKMKVVEVFCDRKTKESNTKTYEELIHCMNYCNNSFYDKMKIVGEPTENALLEYSSNKMSEPKLDRVAEIPFDSDRKMMTVRMNNGAFYTKGAFDRVIKKCKYIMIDGRVIELTETEKKELYSQNENMANKALRVLAFAMSNDNIEEDLIFLGMCGMIDPPRKEVYSAIKDCYKAGLIPVMITGDHKNTAFAIAKQIGITDNINEVITGEEIDKLSEKEFKSIVKDYKVFARVSPEHKMKIVKSLKNLKKIVAMTGDGVNDAPSLKIADIGVGMGKNGTDVVKSVSDILITDDNFANIVVAVREGRKVYSNIQKALQYLISTNMVEVVGMLFAILFFKNSIFLTAAQMLFINLVSDSLPAFALGTEKLEDDVMLKPPRKESEGVLSKDIKIGILYQSIIQCGIVIFMFVLANLNFGSKIANTMTFFTIIYMQLLHSINGKSNSSILEKNLLENKTFNICFIISLAMNLIVSIFPICYSLFGLTKLNSFQWITVAIFSISIIPICEICKIFINGKFIRKIKFLRHKQNKKIKNSTILVKKH